MIRFGSVCSGIEAASIAWMPLGWRPVFFSEIDRAAAAVLAHRHPDVPNLGDMTKFQDWPDATIDLLVGGTPCQSFSVAGLRRGLDDPRGNLMLVYLAIARRYRPRWLVWENVPGVLSSNGGRDFGSLLGGLAELGYGFAYRVLDAQYVRVDGYPRAVPQRRRRVFVVGHLGDWRRAAAVLFEPESLRGDHPPRREAGEGTAVGALAGTSPGGGWRCGPDEAAAGHLITMATGQAGAEISIDHGPTLSCNHEAPIVAGPGLFVAHAAPALTGNPYGDNDAREGLLVSHTLRAEGFDASEDCTGRGTPIVPVAFNWPGAPSQTMEVDDLSPPLKTAAWGIGPDAVDRSGEAADGSSAGRSGLNIVDVVQPTLRARSNNSVATPDVARRLTPRECERLQGFPDDHTRIPVRHYARRTITPLRPADRWEPDPAGGWWLMAADAPRYKQCGNSMAVNCMRWIGQRIALVDEIGGEP